MNNKCNTKINLSIQEILLLGMVANLLGVEALVSNLLDPLVAKNKTSIKVSSSHSILFSGLKLYIVCMDRIRML